MVHEVVHSPPSPPSHLYLPSLAPFPLPRPPSTSAFAAAATVLPHPPILLALALVHCAPKGLNLKIIETI